MTHACAQTLWTLWIRNYACSFRTKRAASANIPPRFGGPNRKFRMNSLIGRVKGKLSAPAVSFLITSEGQTPMADVRLRSMGGVAWSLLL